jgi:hypothetical protein
LRKPPQDNGNPSTACISCGVAFAQTDITNSKAAALQVWDYAEQLDFTPAQKAKMLEIRDRYEAARAALNRASLTNTPPDARLSAQLNLNDQLRLANRRIGELLTDEQKNKLVELRMARTSAARATTQQGTNGMAAADDGESPPLVAMRKPARKLLSEEQNRKLAAELRVMYARPATHWPAPDIDQEVKPYFQEVGLLPLVTYPPDNPYSDAKAELGKKLLFDPRLSGSGQISCASCHDPDLAFADGRTVSFGHERKELKRNAPTVLNAAFSKTLFWDGRAGSLEQ